MYICFFTLQRSGLQENDLTAHGYRRCVHGDHGRKGVPVQHCVASAVVRLLVRQQAMLAVDRAAAATEVDEQ
jgi:hypothetical protein